MPFNVRHMLREIPRRPLQAYFQGRGATTDADWSQKSDLKVATFLAEYLVSDRNEQKDLILG